MASSAAGPPARPSLPGVPIPEFDDDQRPVRVVVLSKDGCHLCDVAVQVVAAVAGEEGVGWVEADAEQSPEVMARYGEWLPVVFVDGVEVAHWRVNPALVKSAVRTGRRPRLRDFVHRFTKS